MSDPKLDDGFEEVGLDEGFEEVAEPNPNTPITNKVGSYFTEKEIDPETGSIIQNVFDKAAALTRGAISSNLPVPMEMAETLTNFPIIRGAEMAARFMNPDLPEVPYTSLPDLDTKRHEITKYLQSKAPGYQKGGEYAGMAIPFLPSVTSKIYSGLQAAKTGLKEMAKKNVLKSTGATAGQLYNLPENAAEELFKRRAIRFGDNVEDIAKRANKILNESGKEIGNVIKKLDDAGVQIDKKQIYNEILDSAEGLSGNEARNAVQGKLNDIASRIKGQAQMVPDVNAPYPKTDEIFPKIKPSKAENIKRDFQNLSNYNDKAATVAEKEAAHAYQKATEKAAIDFDPALAETFKKEKETFGLFKPIEEAATKRALQRNQAASVGLGDIMASAAGGASTGPLGAIGVPIARRGINARYPSSAAITQDILANLIPTGFFGQYSPMLEAAMQKGPQQLAITHYLLSRDPNYQALFNQQE